MQKLSTTLLLLIAVLFLNAGIVSAQDIIVKNDKTEIKSKVAEITETTIRYKKWENIDGPLYNIAKAEVFMIIYANGQRELIKNAQPNVSTSVSTSNSGDVLGLENRIKSSSSPDMDTTVNYKSLKVRYKPLRLNFGLQSPFSIGADQEFRIVKNIFNIGLAFHYLFPKEDYILESSFGFFYGSLYAPVNRLAGNYEKQDKGLFVFADAGYGLSYETVLDYYGDSYATSEGGFKWRIGMDYYLSKGFGLTLSSYEFKNFYGGIAISFR